MPDHEMGEKKIFFGLRNRTFTDVLPSKQALGPRGGQAGNWGKKCANGKQKQKAIGFVGFSLIILMNFHKCPMKVTKSQ